MDHSEIGLHHSKFLIRKFIGRLSKAYIIHQNAWWSVHNIVLEPPEYDRRHRLVQTTAGHLRCTVPKYFICSVICCEHFSMGRAVSRKFGLLQNIFSLSSHVAVSEL